MNNVTFRPVRGAVISTVLLVAALAAGPAPAALDDRDVRVLSALLTHGLEAGTPLVVVAERTTGDPAAITADDALRDAVAGGLEVPPEALASWSRRNAGAHRIERPLDLPVSYQLLDDETLAELFDDAEPGAGWARFFARFEGAPGIVRVSRPGYDDALATAVVYVEHQCGATCGAGRLVRLSSDGTAWRVDGGAVVWMSE